MHLPLITFKFLIILFLVLIFGNAGVIEGKTPSSTDANDKSLSILRGKFSKSKLTIAGIGGGAGFAQIVHLSYSRLFSGISLISPTFYKCGGSVSTLAEWNTMCGRNYTDAYPVKNSLNELMGLAKDGKLDPLKHLKHQKLYLFSTTQSEFSHFNLCFKTVSIFERFMADPRQIKTVVWIGSTRKFDKRFSRVRRERESFQFLLGDRIKATPNFPIPITSFQKFNQKKYFEGKAKVHRFADEGYVYIPIVCRPAWKKCFLQILFSFCRGPTPLDANFPNDIISRVFAEKNHIIYVFPQIKPSATIADNYGCFDYFGFTGKDYASKDGIQVRIIRNMLEDLLGTTID